MSDEISRGELREATLDGVRWMTGAKIAAEVAAFASSVVLAHLISPEEFGRAAIGLIAATLAMMLTWDGFGTPLVQRKAIERAHLESTVLIGLVFGLTMSAATYLLAPALTPVFGSETVDLVQLASPAFLIASLGVVPQSVLQRRLDFRRLSLIDVVAIVGGAMSSLLLATVAGLNGEAVVLGAVIMNAVRTLLLLGSVPLTAPRWRPRAMWEMARFGGPAALSSLAFSGIRNVDYAIVGARLGAAQVGFYWRGFQFAVDYQRKLTGVMVKMALPVYSRTRDLEHMRAIRGRIVRVHVAMMFPGLAGLLATAPVLLPWLLGSNWEPAVVPTQILVVLGMTAALGTGTGPLILAAGHPNALLALNVAYLVLYAAVVWVTAGIGLIAVCIGVAATGLVRTVAVYYLLLDRLIGIPFSRLKADVGPAFVSSLGLLAVAAPLTELGAATGVPAPVTLLVAGAAGTAVYLTALRRWYPATWGDMALLADRVLRRRPRAGRAREAPAHSLAGSS